MAELMARLAEKKKSTGSSSSGHQKAKPPRKPEQDIGRAAGIPVCKRCKVADALSTVIQGSTVRLSPFCGTCGPIAHAEEEAAERAAQERRRREATAYRATNIRDLMGRAGVNVRKYFDATPARFDTFDPNPDRHALDGVRDATEAFRRGERPGLYLYSKRNGQNIAPGNGKTHLPIAGLWTLLLDPAIKLSDLRFVYFPQWLRGVRATFSKTYTGKTESQLLAELLRPELLILDDFGVHNWSDWTVEMVCTILDQRQGLSTWISSNFSHTELPDVAAKDLKNTNPEEVRRIISRIVGESSIYELHGPDRRPMRHAA